MKLNNELLKWLQDVYDHATQPHIVINGHCVYCDSYVAIDVDHGGESGEVTIESHDNSIKIYDGYPQFICKKCVSEGKVHGHPCEIVSRVCGYFSPIQRWNKGKKAEWGERRTYKVQRAFKREPQTLGG